MFQALRRRRYTMRLPRVEVSWRARLTWADLSTHFPTFTQRSSLRSVVRADSASCPRLHSVCPLHLATKLSTMYQTTLFPSTELSAWDSITCWWVHSRPNDSFQLVGDQFIGPISAVGPILSLANQPHCSQFYSVMECLKLRRFVPKLLMDFHLV